MMDKLKIVFMQMLMISTSILCLLSIEGVVSKLLGEEFSLPWYIPGSVILAGVLCSVPTFILFDYKEFSKRRFSIRIICHFLVLYLIVIAIGFVFKWYKAWSGLWSLSISYVVIYILVWVTSIWINKQDDKKINSALKDIQDEE